MPSKLVISNDELFLCSFDGQKVALEDLKRLSNFYEASCIAEDLLTKCDMTTEEALQVGYNAKKLIDSGEHTKNSFIEQFVSDYDQRKSDYEM